MGLKRVEGTTVHTFTASDGVKIRYEIFGSRGEAPPVFLHHGFGADTNVNWVLPGIVAALTRAGRWVVSVDARGHGRSEKPKDPNLYGEKTMARDLVRVADELRVSCFDLVGYSMGAVVSLLVAAADERVRRLVVAGVGAGAVELGGVDQRVLPPASLITALEAEDPGAVDEPMARQFRMFADAVSADRFALAAQARAVHAAPIGLERINAPTLVIAGDDDALADRPEILVRAIREARLQRVQGDHMSALLDPTFASSLVGFLA